MQESPQRTHSFDAFFSELWGVGPFSWQRNLAERVLKSGGASWPEVIELPTGSGKTACLDIAVFALASQGRSPVAGQPVQAPRRVFFVVDRRMIVDEAFDRARKIGTKLQQAKKGVLRSVADNLRIVANGGRHGYEACHPLKAHLLRGGVYRSETWERDPLQPSIIAGTVDQVGSRLLFRSYGRGEGIWPIHAGLIANDSLILLDEAHCALPFLQTLQGVARYRKWAERPLARSFCPVVLSATPPSAGREVKSFVDTSGEGSDPDHLLGKRQLAPKPARLRELKSSESVPKVLSTCAEQLVMSGLNAVVVFANRVSIAREAYGALSTNSGLETILLTGRMRGFDKENQARRLREFELYSSQSAERRSSRPVVVIATQTLEVGADLDFDGLVTECASLDALRQRFGRLNRMGRGIKCRAEILLPQATSKKEDPVYGHALRSTAEWLRKSQIEGEIDFGIAALAASVAASDVSCLNKPALDAPVMLPAHVDCWGQTNPQPKPSPEVSIFLHGPEDRPADVQVCWRADLDLGDPGHSDDAKRILELCPPSSPELMPVPFKFFKRWLSAGESETGVNDESADIEGVDPSAASETGESTRQVMCWHGLRGPELRSANDIRPGEVIVIPTEFSIDSSPLGDLPSDSPRDMGDRAHVRMRAKAMLRLHPRIIDEWPDDMLAQEKELAANLLSDLGLRHREGPEEVAQETADVLKSLANSELNEEWRWLADSAMALDNEYSTTDKLSKALRVVGESLVLAGNKRNPDLAESPEYSGEFSDERDETASATAHPNGRPVLLRTHLPGVAEFARKHAVGCGLSDELVKALELAGRLHDLGKADPRFQSLLRGGSPWWGGDLLAKSAQFCRNREARTAAGYPSGGRHELLSVRLAESAPDMLPQDEDLRALVLHLVASHHGFCRPFAPVVFDEDSIEVNCDLVEGYEMHWKGPTQLERIDSGVSERFWNLTRKYGWWELAWIEALLRTADWRRSAWEENHNAE